MRTRAATVPQLGEGRRAAVQPANTPRIDSPRSIKGNPGRSVWFRSMYRHDDYETATPSDTSNPLRHGCNPCAHARSANAAIAKQALITLLGVISPFIIIYQPMTPRKTEAPVGRSRLSCPLTNAVRNR